MPSLLLLAFGFVSPVLLWGMLLAGVPLLIQWLHRRRYTQRVWAAMRFLSAATESQTRRLRMESLLLLCVRTLILILAAVALAEPYLQSAGWPGADDAATHTLFLLDVSLSMQATVEGTSAADRAREAARSIVRSGRTGDSFQVVTIAAQPAPLIRLPSFSQDDVLAEIDRIAPTASWGNVADALSTGLRVLNESPAAGAKRVVIISDFQRSNWRLEDSLERERTRAALREIARAAAVVLVPVDGGDVGNAAVVDAHADPPLISRGMPTAVTAYVRNFGAEPLRQMPLALLEQGRILKSQAVDVPPYSEATASFEVEWHEVGPHAVQIRCEEDALLADNDRWLTVDVRNELSVLLVEGRVATSALNGATDFVNLALRPSLTAESERSMAPRSLWFLDPTVVPDADLARTELSRFDVVFLCDVPFLSRDETARLERYVRSGGGLVIGLGDQVQLDEYSRALGEAGEGAGLMPVQLIQIVGGDGPEVEPFHFAEPSLPHPLFRSFAGNPRSGLTTANISRYVEIRIPDDSPVRTVLEYAHGAAAVVEHGLGAGRVLLVTTSLDDRWGSWAVWPSFLPMMHDMVQYAAGGQLGQRTLVGESLRVDVTDPGALGHTAELLRPDGSRETLYAERDGDLARFVIQQPRDPGVYQLTPGGAANEARFLAVNVDPRESDLQALNPEDLQGDLFGGIPLDVGGSTLEVSPTATQPQTSVLAVRLLAAVFVLLLVELTMAWKGRYGLIALVASPLVVASLFWLPLMIVVLMLAAAGSAAVWLHARRFRQRIAR